MPMKIHKIQTTRTSLVTLDFAMVSITRTVSSCQGNLACWECHSWHLHEWCRAGKSTLLLRPLISISSFQVPLWQCLKPISLRKTNGYFLLQLQIYSNSIQFFSNPYNTLRVLINNSILSICVCLSKNFCSFSSGEIFSLPDQNMGTFSFLYKARLWTCRNSTAFAVLTYLWHKESISSGCLWKVTSAAIKDGSEAPQPVQLRTPAASPSACAHTHYHTRLDALSMGELKWKCFSWQTAVGEA